MGYIQDDVTPAFVVTCVVFCIALSKITIANWSDILIHFSAFLRWIQFYLNMLPYV